MVARPGEFEDAKRALWMGKLTDEARTRILEIKNAVYDLPDYRKGLLSVHIYEAVLEHDIQGLDNFWAWWTPKYGKKGAGFLA